MSHEFEEKVLQKLDNFEGKFDRIETKLDEHTKILDNHTNILHEHTNILDNHTKILDEHTEQFQNVRKDIFEIQKQLIKGEQRMEEIEEVVEFNTITIKEAKEEINKKIDLILKDNERLNTKVELSRTIISAVKSNNYQNDIRISALEDKINNYKDIA